MNQAFHVDGIIGLDAMVQHRIGGRKYVERHNFVAAIEQGVRFEQRRPETRCTRADSTITADDFTAKTVGVELLGRIRLVGRPRCNGNRIH